jgi:hypothetical protein
MVLQWDCTMIPIIAIVFILFSVVESYDYNGYNEGQSDELTSLQGHFETFLSSLPSNLAHDELQLETKNTIDLIESYKRAKDTIRPYDIFHENTFFNTNYNSFDLDIHATAAFIGFPQSVIPRIRELWFDGLSREDKLESFDSSSGNSTKPPGEVNLKHHFHILETSFHAHDTIANYIQSIMQPEVSSTAPFEYYLNAWEVEAMLYSLTAVMKSAGQQPTTASSLMMYVINLKSTEGLFNGDTGQYSYRDGFSEWDMDLVRASQECKDLALKVLQELPHKSRRSIDADLTLMSLSHEADFENLPPMVDNELPAGISDGAWWRKKGWLSEEGGEETSKDERNEVRSSKWWAREFAVRTRLTGEKVTSHAPAK